LLVVFALFAVLGVNSVYLASITVLEWVTGRTYQDYFYQSMFLLHLVVGLAITPVILAFATAHMANAHGRSNRRAVRIGYALFATAVLLLASGIVLTRLGSLEVKNPTVRGAAYWVHVVTPLVMAWLFVLHRLAGPRVRWRVGAGWAAFAAGFAVIMVALHARNPQPWQVEGPAAGERYFFPSLARTATGNFIPAAALMQDEECRRCHPDIHERWAHSAHRFSSFNNPAYLFSVRETRRVALERDGDVHASRFCAGCHDPVPFFSGAFDDPRFDDVDHPTAQAGLTCTACHAITHVNSPRGNADYTIDAPPHYPFAYSDHDALRWISRQLVKAKPAFHKKTFLKPFHRTAEFCGTCHKVHLPEELNRYKWLRGQNHYDSFLLSGVSGHGVASFYYPERAVPSCSGCHMPLVPSTDFGAGHFDGTDELTVHDHLFAAANTAIPYMLGLPAWVNAAHRAFLAGAVRLDIFAVKEGGAIDGTLRAPVRPTVPALVPGVPYLLEIVVRTLGVGHLFTQGTADSNEVWLDVSVTSAGRVLGRSGGRSDSGEVDPWSHFVNVYVLDRDGHRIDRRNAQDIFVPLYDNQIPPGAADVVHYRIAIPADVTAPVTVEARLRYRKFDTTYMRHFQGSRFTGNDLPITTLAVDRVTFPIAGMRTEVSNEPSPVATWERWNDYGIGLLRKGRQGSGTGEQRQAGEAFAVVERLGRPEGALNLARVHLKEGRLDEAAAALQRAVAHEPPALPWSVAWLSGLVDKERGDLDDAIAAFRSLVTTDFPEARRRGFDFAFDYRLLNEMGQTLFERAKAERAPAARARRQELLREAWSWFERALAIDPENVSAHFNLALLNAQLDEPERAAAHRKLHAAYKPDDNARDRAVRIHRLENPAADHAAEAVVIYDLQRPGAFGRENALRVSAIHE
jgi:tetratricopeptide (TPR) repeat protein